MNFFGDNIRIDNLGASFRLFEAYHLLDFLHARFDFLWPSVEYDQRCVSYGSFVHHTKPRPDEVSNRDKEYG